MNTPPEVLIQGNVDPSFHPVLTSDALKLVVALHRHLEPFRAELMKNRAIVEEEICKGKLPIFPPETKHIRTDPTWKVLPPPEHSKIRKRAVDVVCWKTYDEKFFLECLASGADGMQFDFDDSFAPTWGNCLQSQLNLLNHGCITSLEQAKKNPLILFRPRSLHLDEAHVLVDGQVVAGAIFDMAIWLNTWFHHTSREFRNECYFYVPKMEHYLEARWWDQLLLFVEKHFALSVGTFKALPLIENILASFQMDEIIYEMRNHCLGLNTGKWDYIFSYIKKFRNFPNFTLPDRPFLGMDQPFLATYEKLLIDTCRKRGCFATGGMATLLSTTDDDANQKIYVQILKEKKRGAVAGLNGELVADPMFVEAVRAAYQDPEPAGAEMKADEKTLEQLLLAVPIGKITNAGLLANVNVSLRYISGWLRGQGTVALGSVEDLATAEISRSLLWQWVKHGAKTDDGVLITFERVLGIISNCLSKIKQEMGESEFQQRRYETAQYILANALLDATKYVGFLPDILYPQIVKVASSKL